MIDGQNFFHQPVKNDLRTFDNIRKIVIGLGNYYTTLVFSQGTVKVL